MIYPTKDQHFCDEIARDEEDWWYVICNCGYQVRDLPDLDIAVDMMMDHAANIVLKERKN